MRHGVVCRVAYAAIFSLGMVITVSAAERPDMSGVYMMRPGRDNPTREPYELTPEGEKLYARNIAGVAAGDPDVDTALKCDSTGFPRMLYGPLPFYFLQTGEAVGVIAETDPSPRLIYLNAGHRDDYWPTFMGDSVGRWEGDTLVVDTVKLVESTFADVRGLPHSDQLHVVERIRLIDGGKTMQNEVTIEDPKIFKKAFKLTYLYDRRPDLKPVESACVNTRDRPEHANN